LALAHYGLGLTLFAQGKFDEAIAAHREAIRLKPDYRPAHDGLGQALKAQGKPAGAAQLKPAPPPASARP
jgi:eukaryotic-like serine/threonine-protein kinase